MVLEPKMLKLDKCNRSSTFKKLLNLDSIKQIIQLPYRRIVYKKRKISPYNKQLRFG